jgi:hypothetical protein
MTLRNVPKGYTLEQQRQEINLVAADLNTAIDGVQTFGGNKEFTGEVNFTNDVTLSSTSGDVIVGSIDNPTSSFSIYAGVSPGTINYFTFSAGSNESYIRNVDGTGGGGSINIQGRSGASLWTGTSLLAVAADSNGAGVLYYQSLKKLEATTTGISVTGDIQATTLTKTGGASTEFLKADGSVDTLTYLTTETDPVFSASEAASITSTDTSNWDTAYGWGDHSTEGYLTSYTETDPVFSASEAATITSTDTTNWDSAYGWGDHSTEGYLTSYTETDPVFSASEAATITSTDTTNWDTAYGWGDHSTEGYLTVAAGGTAPTLATDPGTPGEIRYDADNIYICIAANTWKRAPIATW